MELNEHDPSAAPTQRKLIDAVALTRKCNRNEPHQDVRERSFDLALAIPIPDKNSNGAPAENKNTVVTLKTGRAAGSISSRRKRPRQTQPNRSVGGRI
jgi:hypothetical protein